MNTLEFNAAYDLDLEERARQEVQKERDREVIREALAILNRLMDVGLVPEVHQKDRN